MMKVSIIGSGYVGLVSGVCLAERGHDVVCVDVDAAKVAHINTGRPPIHEKGLAALLQRNLACRFRATTDLRDAVLNSDVSIIAVGTPYANDYIDLQYVREVAGQIGTVLRDKPAYHCVVVKSTVLPGTTEEVVLPLLEATSGKKAGRDFGVAMNPEFLRQGEAVQDFLFPDRIVMGGSDQRATNVLADLYHPFSGVDKVRTNPRTAETIKYTANALLATMISFSNEIGNLCSSIGDVDVVDVMQGVHLDKRLSPILSNGQRVRPAFTTYLEAGCGFGGSCFPKDVNALIAHGRKSGVFMQLLDAVMEINARQPYKVLDLLRHYYPDLAGVRVAVLGLAFKPGTDDVRESPALPVVRELLACGARVTAFDPIAGEAAERVLEGSRLDIAPNLGHALRGAQAVLLLTTWDEFRQVPKLLAALPEPPVLIDGRRMLGRDEWPNYAGIGFRRRRSSTHALKAKATGFALWWTNFSLDSAEWAALALGTPFYLLLT
jgi:UDPglucose 6-dehydrogenase/GDP-mannose 6-dehydrogenase